MKFMINCGLFSDENEISDPFNYRIDNKESSLFTRLLRDDLEEDFWDESPHYPLSGIRTPLRSCSQISEDAFQPVSPAVDTQHEQLPKHGRHPSATSISDKSESSQQSKSVNDTSIGKTKQIQKKASRGYALKNFLQFAKNPSLKFIELKKGRAFIQDHQFLSYLSQKSHITRQDYLKLYGLPELKETWGQFFQVKYLHRELMNSRVEYLQRPIFLEGFERFEEIYKNKFKCEVALMTDNVRKLVQIQNKTYVPKDKKKTTDKTKSSRRQL